MLQNKFIAWFCNDNKKLETYIKAIKSSRCIAESVEMMGIAIPWNDCITKDDIFSIATSCPNLRMIDMHNSNASLSIIRVISLNCKKLTHLGLGKCNFISKEMINYLSEQCEHLEVIQVPHCTNLTFKYPAFPKAGSDSNSKPSSIFGVEIESYEIIHYPNKCLTSHFCIYRIGSFMGMVEFKGKMLKSLNKRFYGNM